MIKEDYVSFETAKLLKEKGFDGDSHYYYDKDGDLLFTSFSANNVDNVNTVASTLQMAMKWLREMHNIHVVPKYDFYSGDYTGRIYDGRRETVSERDDYIAIVGNSTYEQAAEAAIKYCLENLINNDKNDECEDNANKPFAITMEQDLGQVLMNSLCAMLPYGVIVSDGPAEQRGKLWSVSHDYMVSYESDVSKELERQSIFNVRCYLRPISSMTEKETIAYTSLCQHKVDDMGNEWFADTIESFDWLNAHHFDYRGLIKKGQALEAPKGMYKTE